MMAHLHAICLCSSFNLRPRYKLDRAHEIHRPRIMASRPVQLVRDVADFRPARENRNIRAVAESKEAAAADCGGAEGKIGRKKLKKVVVAYSGGLDTSVVVPWLRENYGCEVVCFTVDIGQGELELEGLEQKAKASGASQLVVKDLKEEFITDFIFPCLRAGAVYERKYLLGTSMARPLIAKMLVDVAEEVGADVVSHGCTTKSTDQA